MHPDARRLFSEPGKRQLRRAAAWSRAMLGRASLARITQLRSARCRNQAVCPRTASRAGGTGAGGTDSPAQDQCARPPADTPPDGSASASITTTQPTTMEHGHGGAASAAAGAAPSEPDIPPTGTPPPLLPALRVTGAPDPGQLYDVEWHRRLEVLSEPLAQQLGIVDGAAPTPTGRLTGVDLAGVLYQLQIFQEEVLGVAAPRPANPDAVDPLARHPTRLPAWCFRLWPDVRSRQTLQALLFSVLQQFARAIPLTGEDILEPSRRPFYTSLVANTRAELRAQGILPAISVYAPPEWPHEKRVQAQAWSQFLERMSPSTYSDWCGTLTGIRSRLDD